MAVSVKANYTLPATNKCFYFQVLHCR